MFLFQQVLLGPQTETVVFGGKLPADGDRARVAIASPEIPFLGLLKLM